MGFLSEYVQHSESKQCGIAPEGWALQSAAIIYNLKYFCCGVNRTLCVFPQTDGVIVGFIGLTADVDFKELHNNFHFSEINELYKVGDSEAASPAAAGDDSEEPGQVQTFTSQQEPDLQLKV